MDTVIQAQAKKIVGLQDEIKVLRLVICPFLLKNHDLEKERELMKVQHQKDIDHIRGLIIDKGD